MSMPSISSGSKRKFSKWTIIDVSVTIEESTGYIIVFHDDVKTDNIKDRQKDIRSKGRVEKALPLCEL